MELQDAIRNVKHLKNPYDRDLVALSVVVLSILEKKAKKVEPIAEPVVKAEEVVKPKKSKKK